MFCGYNPKNFYVFAKVAVLFAKTYWRARQNMLPDDDFIGLAEPGYDTQQIARALRSDINLVAIKGDLLRSQGY